MKKIIITIYILLISMNVFAQTLDINQSLPENQRVKKGVLKNGMTYYIYKTDVVKNAASYYIIQNVGSILENEDQLGLAHFLEHMAFNGTKNYPGKGVLTTLQKYGAVFGDDINAHTAFDETVYNMNNIPTKDGMIDKSLLILHDWANELSLEENEIDAERGVVTEEKRTRNNGQMRVILNSLPEMYVGSKYADRVPIGSMDIVANFKYKTLRDYYHDWYRTDLQAIAVIGDFDEKEIEQKIIKLFSKIPAVKNPKERFYVTIPENEEMLYKLSMDKEVSTSSINFNIHSNKNLKDETVLDLKNSLLDNIFTSLLSKRFNEYSQKTDAPFLMAFSGIKSLSRTENNFTTYISPKSNQQQDAFKTALQIINKAVKFGFTQSEIDREIAILSNYYETQISQEKTFPHSAIETSIEMNYLENETFTDAKAEYEIAKLIFQQLSVKQVQDHLKKYYTNENRVLLVTGVEGRNNLSKKDALHIINEVENDKTLQPYVDAFSGKTLLSDTTIKPGKIVSETENKEIEATTFVLSNGINVHHKYYDKEVNSVQLLAVSFGGTSLLNDEDLPSASQVQALSYMSGVGDYKATDLIKVLAGKTASAGITLSGLSESVTGSSTTKDVETMLQLTYLRFVKPRFDKDSYEVLIHNAKNIREVSKKNIQIRMMDSVSVTLYGKNNPKERIQDDAYIQDISFEKIKKIYLDRFNDASDFEFFITGDVKKEDLKPLLEKYIASIPTKNTKETWKDNSVSWVQKNIDKDIYLKMEDPKTSVNISYKNDVKWGSKNQYLMSSLQDILKLRFTETLREEEGGTYGANVYGMLYKRPKNEARLMIMFDCNPEKAEKLISIVHREIDKIKQGEISSTDLEKTLTNYKKQLAERVEKNDYAQKLLYNYFVEGKNISDPKYNIEILNSLTKKDLQDFTNEFIQDAKSYEIVFKPKK